VTRWNGWETRHFLLVAEKDWITLIEYPESLNLIEVETEQFEFSALATPTILDKNEQKKLEVLQKITSFVSKKAKLRYCNTPH
jgi:hypothetical protein